MAAVFLRMLAAGLLLLLTSLPYGQPQGENDLYVKPSTPDTQCPEDNVCLTLSEYAEMSFDSNTTLMFLPGDHILDKNFTVTNIATLTLLRKSASETRITCTAPVAFRFEDISHVSIGGLTFLSCGSDFIVESDYEEITFTAIIVKSVQHFELSSSILKGNRNGTLSISSSNAILSNNVMSYNGGGVSVEESNVTFMHNVFEHNHALIRSAILTGNSTLFLSGNVFHNNRAYCGGAIYAYDSSVTFTGSVFTSNSAYYDGGAIYAYDSSMSFNGSVFISNSAYYDDGGAIYASYSSMSFTGSNFTSNSANEGGAIWAVDSVISFTDNNDFTNNKAEFQGGGMYVSNGNIYFNGSSALIGNVAGMYGGGILAIRSRIIFTGKAIFRENMISSTSASVGSGGGIRCLYSTSIHFAGSSIFEGNSAPNGGGLAVELSGNVTFDGGNNFTGNVAESNGGGIYVSFSNLTFTTGNTTFTNNSAMKGGGLSLESNAKIYLSLGYTKVYFLNNSAQENGGALYVMDNPLAYCGADIECFFQIIENNSTKSFGFPKTLFFRNNTAMEGGNSLYGGAIDYCQLAAPYYYSFYFDVFDKLAVMEEEPSNISSDPLQITFCGDSTEYYYSPPKLHPGESIYVSLLALGQRDGPVSAIIQSDFETTAIARFSDDTGSQRTNSNCTKLKYTLIAKVTNVSKPINQSLTLSTEGLCQINLHSISFTVTFEPCPPGFNLGPGVCICNKRLQSYTKDCNNDNQKIKRQGVFWVGYDNKSDGVIFHPHCPFDYCKPETKTVVFTLAETEKQCNYNRSNHLCGACLQNRSLVFGSSRCLDCGDETSRLALLIPFALAGFALVVFLLVSKLTVADGTINGLIFYANIIAPNRAIFFPQGDTNILTDNTIFISWLNLDLGIETCFYDGMDAYAKTWLQYVFPIYIWIIVGMIILASNYSQRVAKSMGTNPIAVLATLFLLSYTKILRTIIASLSFTTLEYPNRDETVWLYDGNISYFSGKHTVLFVVGLLVFLFLFLPYTLLLATFQWIQALSHLKLFSWVSSPRLKSFMDAYNAPYKPKARYWTGLLLLVRSALLLTFLLNYKRDPSINLLAIIATCLGLTTLVWIKRDGVYNKWYLDAIEGSFILNLGILAAATYHIKFSTIGHKNDNQTVATYLSVGIAFVTFIMILMYHLYIQLKDTHIWKSMKSRFDKIKTMVMFHRRDYNTQEEDKETLEETTASTTSYVELRELLLEEN